MRWGSESMYEAASMVGGIWVKSADIFKLYYYAYQLILCNTYVKTNNNKIFECKYVKVDIFISTKLNPSLYINKTLN